ncbi:unnamed protein product [Echinostoma caproni]|uniref:GGDEF domain-containing protein n=1 Tax=Echinostoma caproni TaxID=27848 RepID=A0A183B7Q0_9TREM|nr:unnamed protein product [Echinostoma caproni]
MSAAPTWKSEDELEQLVTDAQEQLENLRENTDEKGRLNDETLIRYFSKHDLPIGIAGFLIDYNQFKHLHEPF